MAIMIWVNTGVVTNRTSVTGRPRQMTLAENCSRNVYVWNVQDVNVSVSSLQRRSSALDSQ